MKSEFVLSTSKKTGFLKRDICILSFFKEEILVTSLNNKKQKELFMIKKNKEKESGGGLIKQTIAMQSAIPEYTNMIKNMDKEDIKKESTESISKGSITKIKFKNASRHEDYENNTSSLSEGKLILYVNDNKIIFKHLYEDKTKEISNYIDKYL